MDQDATWYRGRPWLTRHCVRWGLNSTLPKGAQPRQFSAHFYCGQTAGCIMPLGMEVSLGPDDIVLDGGPAPPPQKGHSPPIFCPCLLLPNGRPSQLLLSSCLQMSGNTAQLTHTCDQQANRLLDNSQILLTDVVGLLTS